MRTHSNVNMSAIKANRAKRTSIKENADKCTGVDTKAIIKSIMEGCDPREAIDKALAGEGCDTDTSKEVCGSKKSVAPEEVTDDTAVEEAKKEDKAEDTETSDDAEETEETAVEVTTTDGTLSLTVQADEDGVSYFVDADGKKYTLTPVEDEDTETSDDAADDSAKEEDAAKEEESEETEETAAPVDEGKELRHKRVLKARRK